MGQNGLNPIKKDKFILIKSIILHFKDQNGFAFANNCHFFDLIYLADYFLT